MSSIQAIIDQVNRGQYDTRSGLVIELCTELARIGRFADVSDALEAWFLFRPESRKYVLGKLPEIIMEVHLEPKAMLGADQTVTWLAGTPNWANDIKWNALNGQALQKTVDSLLASMQQVPSSEK
ncbi:MAG: hypothetical protein JO269_03165 [Burkholderiaceae bacterium]|nr:hypothetical protein [Burkholderiaceae bacterium]